MRARAFQNYFYLDHRVLPKYGGARVRISWQDEGRQLVRTWLTEQTKTKTEDK